MSDAHKRRWAGGVGGVFCSKPSPLPSPPPAAVGCTRARTLRTHASVMAARKYNDKRHRERASLHHRSARPRNDGGGRERGTARRERGSVFVPNERGAPVPRRVASRRVMVDRLIASRCENNEITELSKCLARRESIPAVRLYATCRDHVRLRLCVVVVVAVVVVVVVPNDFLLSFCPILFSVLAAWTLRGSL